MDRQRYAGLMAILLSVVVAPADAQHAYCDDQSNMHAIRACLYTERMRVVEARFKQVRSGIAAQDPQAATALDRAQVAWKAFMDASCDYRASVAPDGMYPQDARLMCQTDFMDARVRILESYRGRFERFPAR